MVGILKRTQQRAVATKGRKTPRLQKGKFTVQVEVDAVPLKQLGASLNETVLAEAARLVGDIVIAEARSNLAEHTDTGRLSESLTQKTIQYRADNRMFHIIGPEADAFWGYFLEFGTVRQPPRPWFRRAVETTLGRQQIAFEQYAAQNGEKA